MINLQKIIDYLEQHNISEETFMISTGLSKSSLIKAKGSLSADDYLTICSTLGVSPWFLNYTVPIIYYFLLVCLFGSLLFQVCRRSL